MEFREAHACVFMSLCVCPRGVAHQALALTTLAPPALSQLVLFFYLISSKLYMKTPRRYCFLGFSGAREDSSVTYRTVHKNTQALLFLWVFWGSGRL